MGVNSTSNASYVTMQQNTIRYMLQYIDEYELVKNKEHTEYRFVRALLHKYNGESSELRLISI